MTSPDSETRFFSGLQRIEGTEEERQRVQKIIDDLRHGFRINRAAPLTDYVYVVTRNNDDLFQIQLGIDNLVALPHDPVSNLETFPFYEIQIVRKKREEGLADPASEVWSTTATEFLPIESSYTSSRADFSDGEFWAGYNGSTFDPLATQELTEIMTDRQGSHEGFQLTWLPRQIPE